ncbi:hypothetical protein QBC38DRAFT_547830 [Podospora fimiseda]|uniref:Uncharacterized protein n=1 Tax=Podospora fimiseda TaxID=252190 RepID=A0AAN7GR96_9PEZI|nr:hypothetical protein QBC38DRAFT_547830 [Podospora fimiseda]
MGSNQKVKPEVSPRDPKSVPHKQLFFGDFLPHQPPLNNEDDLESWSSQLNFTATTYDLHRYLEQSVHPPHKGTPEYSIWERDCLGLIDMMWTSIRCSEIRYRVANMGWTSSSMDPCLLRRYILRAIDPEILSRRLGNDCALIRDFFSPRLQDFQNTADYYNRLIKLKEEMEVNFPTMSEKALTCGVLNSIRQMNKNLYDKIISRMETEGCTWHVLDTEATRNRENLDHNNEPMDMESDQKANELTPNKESITSEAQSSDAAMFDQGNSDNKEQPRDLADSGQKKTTILVPRPECHLCKLPLQNLGDSGTWSCLSCGFGLEITEDGEGGWQYYWC